jgi:O-acetyl-ADP-ribose deacetylase (regulator of RNase III)
VPYLIVAPTMTMPEEVASNNCYRAMRAVLRIADAYPEVAEEIFCPGLGTGVGMVPPRNSAAMMAQAFRDWKSSVGPKAKAENGGDSG